MNEFTDVLQNQFSSGAYTHHQKCLISDVPGSSYGSRRLIAYVGGLDLTGGRYDTPNHELFKTLLNEHEGDFRNSNAKFLEPTQGPREPWHDIHSMVEGPVAYDVFQNFHERWKVQGNGEFLSADECQRYKDSTVNTPLMEMDQGRLWNCQFFRSITSDSAKFDEELVEHVSMQIMLLKNGRANTNFI